MRQLTRFPVIPFNTMLSPPELLGTFYIVCPPLFHFYTLDCPGERVLTASQEGKMLNPRARYLKRCFISAELNFKLKETQLWIRVQMLVLK